MAKANLAVKKSEKTKYQGVFLPAVLRIRSEDIFICMKLKNHINIRITDDQLKQLRKMTLKKNLSFSRVIRELLQNGIGADCQSMNPRKDTIPKF